MPHQNDYYYRKFLIDSPYSYDYGVGPALKSSEGSPEKFVKMMGGYSDKAQKQIILDKLDRWQDLFKRYKISNNQLVFYPVHLI